MIAFIHNFHDMISNLQLLISKSARFKSNKRESVANSCTYMGGGDVVRDGGHVGFWRRV